MKFMLCLLISLSPWNTKYEPEETVVFYSRFGLGRTGADTFTRKLPPYRVQAPDWSRASVVYPLGFFLNRSHACSSTWPVVPNLPLIRGRVTHYLPHLVINE